MLATALGVSPLKIGSCERSTALITRLVLIVGEHRTEPAFAEVPLVAPRGGVFGPDGVREKPFAREEPDRRVDRTTQPLLALAAGEDEQSSDPIVDRHFYGPEPAGDHLRIHGDRGEQFGPQRVDRWCSLGK
jgi:hypothetical protein